MPGVCGLHPCWAGAEWTIPGFANEPVTGEQLPLSHLNRWMLSGSKRDELEHSFHLTEDSEQIPASLVDCLVCVVDGL